MSLVLSWVRPISSEIFLTISFFVTMAVSLVGRPRSERGLAQLYGWLGLVSRKKPTGVPARAAGRALGRPGGARALGVCYGAPPLLAVGRSPAASAVRRCRWSGA